MNDDDKICFLKMVENGSLENWTKARPLYKKFRIQCNQKIPSRGFYAFLLQLKNHDYLKTRKSTQSKLSVNQYKATIKLKNLANTMKQGFQAKKEQELKSKMSTGKWQACWTCHHCGKMNEPDQVKKQVFESAGHRVLAKKLYQRIDQGFTPDNPFYKNLSVQLKKVHQT